MNIYDADDILLVYIQPHRITSNVRIFIEHPAVSKIVVWLSSFCRSQFKHMRMADSGNVEISNPIYMRDYDEDENEGPGDAFTFDPDKVSYLYVILS